LTSGPNTGGENNQGTIVTIYGKRFGSERGSSTVTVGGGTVAAYKLWSDTKIAVAIGSAATTGNIVVHTSAGDSNGVPFTVRAGNIYCVSTAGSDSNSGRFPNSCWRTIANAKDTISAGDIAYVLTGVSQTAEDNYRASLAVMSGGTASAPKAIVAYPGATVTVGSNSREYGIRTPAIGGSFNYWVLAGLAIRGVTAVDLLDVDGWRVIGNDISCPNGAGATACFHTDSTTNLKFFGNYVHHTGTNCGSDCKLYHAVYFTTNSNYIEMAWNTVVPNPDRTSKAGCRAVQFYSTGGSDQYGLSVHDNLVHDAICDGINFSTVDPSRGVVEAYNNVVYRVGTGPDPSGQASNYTCFNVDGSSGGGTAELYNNTVYDCGSRGGGDAGALSLYINTRLRNNIIRQLSGESYFSSGGGNCSRISGSSNIWYGAGSAPSCANLTGNINSDPKFVNVANFDFHLQTGSPAIGAGVNIPSLATDIDGVSRPSGGAPFDLGAYQFLQRPDPPSGLTAVVR